MSTILQRSIIVFCVGLLLAGCAHHSSNRMIPEGSRNPTIRDNPSHAGGAL